VGKYSTVFVEKQDFLFGIYSENKPSGDSEKKGGE
jgi:hypothetical protein